MTFAQAANRETCAGAGCHQPVEAYLSHVTASGPVSLGYCLDCILRLPTDLPAPAVASERPQRRKRRLGW